MTSTMITAYDLFQTSYAVTNILTLQLFCTAVVQLLCRQSKYLNQIVTFLRPPNLIFESMYIQTDDDTLAGSGIEENLNKNYS